MLRFFGLPEVSDEAAAALLPTLGYTRVAHNPCVQYVLRRPPGDFVLQQWSDDLARLKEQGYVTSRLRPSDAELVDCVWPYRSAWSLDYIRNTIIGGGHLCTSCIREGGEDGAPVSWAVEYRDGSFGMLTTLEGHRRKGLARLALVALLRDMVEGGRLERHPLFCYVVTTNVPSRSLLESLGFEETSVFVWQAWQVAKGDAVQQS